MAPSMKTPAVQHSARVARKSSRANPIPVRVLAVALSVGVLWVVGVRLVSGPAVLGASAPARR